MKYLIVNLKIKYDSVNLDGTLINLIDYPIAKKYGCKFKTELDVGLPFIINDYSKSQILNQ